MLLDPYHGRIIYLAIRRLSRPSTDFPSCPRGITSARPSRVAWVSPNRTFTEESFPRIVAYADLLQDFCSVSIPEAMLAELDCSNMASCCHDSPLLQGSELGISFDLRITTKLLLMKQEGLPALT